jgi:hypothetical protein
LSLCTTAHLLHTIFAKIIGASVSETIMRPNPRRGAALEHAARLAAAVALQVACRRWRWRRRRAVAAAALCRGYRRHLAASGGVSGRRALRKAALTLQAGLAEGCTVILRL